MIEWIKSITNVEASQRKTIGILLMLIVCCSFCYVAVVIKSLKNMNTTLLLLYRSTFSFLCNSFQIPKQQTFLKEENLSKIVYTRLIFSGVIDFCMIGAYQYLFLSEAVSLMLTYPIIKYTFAKLLLEENMRRSVIIPALLTLAGVVLITKPHKIFDHFVISEEPKTKEERNYIHYQTFGYFLAIIFSLSLSTMDLIIHHMRQKIPSAVLMQYSYFGSILFSTFMIIWREYQFISFTLYDFLLIFSAGFFYFLGQTLFGKALVLGRSTSIIPLTYLQILIQIFIDIYVYNQNLSGVSILGSILIALGNVKIIVN